MGTRKKVCGVFRGAGTALLAILLLAGLAAAANVKPGPAGKVLRSVQPMPQAAKEIARPDIALDDIWVDIHCRLWVRWKNVGNKKIDAVLREKVSVYSQPLSSDNMYQVVLEPGAVFAHGVGADPGLKLQGPGTVNAWIDADNVLKEINEANNSMPKTLSCGRPQPDLVPSYISCSTNRHYTNNQGWGCDVFKVSVTIKNIGAADVANPFTVKVGGAPGPSNTWQDIGTYTVPGMAAGATLKLMPEKESDTCTLRTSDRNGNRNPAIKVTVDDGNAVAESLEDNNWTVDVNSCRW